MHHARNALKIYYILCLRDPNNNALSTTNEELRRLVEVELITTFIRSGRLRWYGHVMRKGNEDWVKKCMEYRVEGRIPVGRPIKTWLESVEADMAELEIAKISMTEGNGEGM